ncbi:FecR family protein [Dyadobacter psychrotolerans]|uniref:FecR family protein n=1 Tax=Dyadobacter psychrotolerans TaxID=2541721 RepID=A0A4R5DX65_9BACT|nr:FecR family protein [Dyadobacter psychrotolerans]TDE16761.1 FecR family protein [Dyadobacter psychrotolerans]
MKFAPYTLTELIRNDDFISWVRHPDAESEARWQQFLLEYPEKTKVVEDARGYVNLLAEDTGKSKPTIEQTNKMWRVVESHLHEENVEDVQQPKIISAWKWLRIAASIALVLGITSVSYWYLNRQTEIASVIGPQVAVTENGLIEKFNDTGKPMTVLLADGSSVVLQPNGKLSFSSKINTKKREVNLTGKAFFEIVKDPQRPFLVYTDGIATKVLGTSFLVDAPENGSEINVEVKTGKVSVFALNKNASLSEREEAEKPELKGIILSRDQKIAFSRVSGKPVKLPETSLEIANVADISTQLFVFDETPMSEVFKALESAYNIKIIYNESLISNCPLNATLIGQPFTEKLTVICAALDAQFEIKDNQVTITGNGCR